MELSQDIKYVIHALMEFFIYAISVTIAMLVLFIDIVWLGNELTELSLTEFIQESSLLFMVIMYAKLTFCFKNQRNIHLLIAGFFSCLLIRELDSFLDSVFHGFWLYPALLVSLVSLILTFGRDFKQTIAEIATYVQHSQYAYMLVGLICILVFSRLFGTNLLWCHLLNEHYQRVVKNLAEEGAELLGYTFCFISSWRYYYQFNLKDKSKSVLLLHQQIKPTHLL